MLRRFHRRSRMPRRHIFFADTFSLITLPPYFAFRRWYFQLCWFWLAITRRFSPYVSFAIHLRFRYAIRYFLHISLAFATLTLFSPPLLIFHAFHFDADYADAIMLIFTPYFAFLWYYVVSLFIFFFSLFFSLFWCFFAFFRCRCWCWLFSPFSLRFHIMPCCLPLPVFAAFLSSHADTPWCFSLFIAAFGFLFRFLSRYFFILHSHDTPRFFASPRIVSTLLFAAHVLPPSPLLRWWFSPCLPRCLLCLRCHWYYFLITLRRFSLPLFFSPLLSPLIIFAAILPPLAIDISIDFRCWWRVRWCHAASYCWFTPRYWCWCFSLFVDFRRHISLHTPLPLCFFHAAWCWYFRRRCAADFLDFRLLPDSIAADSDAAAFAFRRCFADYAAFAAATPPAMRCALLIFADTRHACDYMSLMPLLFSDADAAFATPYFRCHFHFFFFFFFFFFRYYAITRYYALSLRHGAMPLCRHTFCHDYFRCCWCRRWCCFHAASMAVFAAISPLLMLFIADFLSFRCWFSLLMLFFVFRCHYWCFRHSLSPYCHYAFLSPLPLFSFLIFRYAISASPCYTPFSFTLIITLRHFRHAVIVAADVLMAVRLLLTFDYAAYYIAAYAAIWCHAHFAFFASFLSFAAWFSSSSSPHAWYLLLPCRFRW